MDAHGLGPMGEQDLLSESLLLGRAYADPQDEPSPGQ